MERNAADLGTTLVELLAHTADRISYQQDAVATEAYLDTARRRVSVRRHVRLIDYPMHDGVNARAFVAVETVRELTLGPGTYRFAAVDVRSLGPRDRPAIGTVIDDRDLAVLDERGSVEVFEPVVADEPLALRPEHNTIRFWTWGDEACSLPKGATSATLRDGWADEECLARSLELAPGDLLLIEEVLGRAPVRRATPTPPIARPYASPRSRRAWTDWSTSRYWRSPGRRRTRWPSPSVCRRGAARTASRSRM